ncbi:putative AMP-dependent synthetase/ligase, amine oxidase, phosphopantetheine binding ACP [Helianthus annuus]|nr:putative AMP-dependent synthetase/ligase, amine oxidase, phosphopantetheine binding ACP [Helianthus annuus]KAJ0729203.1 putative AMP-dependent synthetase/ligase, amine oxidase, phosphopantetheine binding ACP [Helianthus annuus]KAJ0731942.1 putative AMP-dependent synthetase/ligase, amine oxidase, phosphopantetheine binding ACP [Helianthus annuus]KAJ0955083.1 putative AMP-dependent synthetase/ligase, amine oxidase, phosphopantetheine binding ACP [Helianthus annuus]
MDLKQSVADQFTNLHPCMPVNTRIAILGGGPSGLSAAYALAKLGYNNVTLVEKYHTVSGMCESAEIEGKMHLFYICKFGKVYDLGGQVLAANSAPTIFHLAKELGSELEEMDSHKLALIDSSTGKYEDIKVADDYLAVVSLTLELQDKAKNSGRNGVHAISEFASEQVPEFLETKGLKSVPNSVVYGYTASGYGFVEDMPYAYIHEFTRTSMAGKIRRFKGGYMGFWQKLSKSLPVNIQCNTEVLAIKRNSSSVSVNIKNSIGEVETVEFDKVIISGAFPFTNGKMYRSPTYVSPETNKGLMDLSDLEKELFSKVETIDYYTTVMKIKGLDHLPIGFYYFAEFMNPSTIGNPVAVQKFYADTDIYLFWSYGNAVDVTGPRVTELATEVVNSMGGQVESVILQRRFKYFPHVSSQDMKDGFYNRMENELQGQQNTYYVGGLVAFELTERNSSYSMNLIRKHFANDDPLPKFPYVKRLFPLLSDSWDRNPEPLDEYPGVTFPDLNSLDGYLKHWGTHELTREKTLYTWINDDGEEAYKRTYAELNANASCIAHKLLTGSKPVIRPGDRVLLLHVPGLDFVDAFFGCLRARVLPVPVLPPDPLQRGGQALLKLENIAKSSNAKAILSTVLYHGAVRAGNVKNLISLSSKGGKSSAKWPNLPWIHTDSLVKNAKGANFDIKDDSEPMRDDLCFLQFTSGSTGDAKGVMITHGGLIHNVKLMRKRYQSTSRTVLVSWLPQYHDMGLIGGLFTSLVSGGSAILLSPMTFIVHPLLWLQTMSKYRATHSAGPNFAFELVVRRLEGAKDKVLDYDLSSMKFLMIAAEPVRQKTLMKFIQLTAPFGLSQHVMAPGYGLAENCVYVCCAYGEKKPILIDWQGRVCCGYVHPSDEDVDIKIVDPETCLEHDEPGKEGEIWISSPSAGIGYWEKEELSQSTFKNSLENCSGKIYTRTGDLGRIIDGNLFITGRIKDLIIVGGRNIYSADIEKTVESASEFLRPGCCAVIGVPEETLSTKGISVPDGSDQVGLVVIAEVRDGKPVNKEVVQQIQARVAEEHGVSIASVKLIKPRTISKTTSGKLKRFECLKQFTDGTLNLVPEPIVTKKRLMRSYTTGTCREGNTPRPDFVANRPLPDAGPSHKEIEEFLKGLVSEQTGISVNKISTTEGLTSYGIDSIGVVRAAQKLSDFLGVPVGAVDVFTATCISDLASFSENLVMKSQPNQTTQPFSVVTDHGDEGNVDLLTEVSTLHQFGIWTLQILALVYMCMMLVLPAYQSISMFMKFIPSGHSWTGYITSLLIAPIVWIFCIFATCISVAFFGTSFLQPNYALTPEVSIWSMDFVKWWTLYKAQDIASNVMAVHLRGTVFLKYWFELFGARIGSSVLLDTVNITDPALVSIGDQAVVAEGALIQGHEVRNGVLSFMPIRIGQRSEIGPYAVIQRGSILGEEAKVGTLQKTETGKPVSRSGRRKNVQKDVANDTQTEAIYHLMGIYVVGFLSSLSAAIAYFLYVSIYQESPSLKHFSFLCVAGAFHWLPFTIIAYAAMIFTTSVHPLTFATTLSAGYLAHGLILSLLTCTVTRFLDKEDESPFEQWLRHRINIACHLRFAKLLSGTEAFCVYLRLLGAKIGNHCSIRAINPVSDPRLISLGAGVHLGDFSRIVAGFYARNGFKSGNIKVDDNAVVGSQSILLPGSVVENSVILGALSVAPVDSVLKRGGVYIGSETPVMIKNTMHDLDDRIEEMDMKYKKIVGNLAANLAATTLKVKSRYFHRIGVSGKGVLKIYDNITGFPNHKIFYPGKNYPVIIRHSNSLSADDDARIDARGAAVRILTETGPETPLLDLTLKSGNAFYARTISDFATWLVCGLPAREQHVKRVPHVRDAVWTSLRNTDSFTNLHYFSNICRLFRFEDGSEMYVKFKLRPFDDKITEDSGKVEPIGILPPETGAIPRDVNDKRPPLFLADDFKTRVSQPGGVRYIFQLQFRPVPNDDVTKDVALDCTKPWDATEFPYVDVGEITIDQNNTQQQSEELEFNPFLRCNEVDVIRATSASQSASIDHGRSLIYEICQHLRNGQPLPESWRNFIEQSDVKVDLSGCPMAATLATENKSTEVTLTRTWYQTSWTLFGQPLLQTFLPYYLMGLLIAGPLNLMFYVKEKNGYPVQWLLPVFWVWSGMWAGLACVIAKWVVVGKKKDGGSVLIWGKEVFMDTIWQAFRTLVGEYFMEMVSGSFLFTVWMKMMGSEIDLNQGVYVDSMGAVLNPEMVEIEGGGCVGREALLFGHIYEGDGGKVKFGKIRIGEDGFVGSRSVVMPGVNVENGGSLSALSLAFKGEIIKSK